MQTPDVAGLSKQLRTTRTQWQRLIWGTDHDVLYPKLPAGGDAVQWLLKRMLRHSESVLVPIFGPDGERHADLCEKIGADVMTLEQKFGEVFDQETIIAELRQRKPSVLLIAHGDSRIGQLQPLYKLGRVCLELDILFLVDVSATSGIVPIHADEWYVDAILTGTASEQSGKEQPLAINEQVAARICGTIESRIDAEDLVLMVDTLKLPGFICNRLGRTSLKDQELNEIYAIRKGNVVSIEAALNEIGIRLYGQQSSRLPSVICIEIPAGVEAQKLQERCRTEYGMTCHSYRPSAQSIPLLVFELQDGLRRSRDDVLEWLVALESALANEGYEVNKEE
ncbi:aminotransferase class V-fold PLP-dependent enzyme [Paenibacillus sp. strain BS8-2]